MDRRGGFDKRGFEQILQQFAKVRDRDFYDVPLKGGRWLAPEAAKRRPIAKEERAATYQERTAAAAGATADSSRGTDSPHDDVAATEVPTRGPPTGDFFKELYEWIEGAYPDRKASTALKVAFKKEHISLCQNLCLEDLEEISAALSSA